MSGLRSGQRLLDLHEAANYLGCSERTVKNLILDGKIPVVKLTSRNQFDLVDLNKLIESSKEVYKYRD